MNVLTPVVIVFGVTAAKKLVVDGTFDVKVLVGGFVFGLLLFGLNEANSEVATAFAWVAAITAVLINGAPLFKAIQGGLK